MANINTTVFFLAAASLIVVPENGAYAQESGQIQSVGSPAAINNEAVTPGITENVARYGRELKKISSRSGKSPTLAELRRLLTDSRCSLAHAEYLSLLGEFIRMQHPKVGLKDICRLRSSLRDTIRTVDLEWEVELGPGNDESSRAGRYRFLMDSSKLMYESKSGANLSELHRTHLRSYDGSAETVYNADVLGGQAVIHKMVANSYYFEWHNPLWLAKMIDTQKHLGRSSSVGMENLDNRLAYPLEELAEFHGRKCVVLLEQENTYFLDPSMNYAYCGLEAGRYRFDDKLGRLVSRNSYRTEVLDDFKDCGNGLWLPMKDVDTAYKEGSPSCTNTVRVLRAEVNVPLDGDRFVNVVPKGVEVVSGIDGAVRVHDNVSPDASLDSAIRARTGQRTHIFVVAARHNTWQTRRESLHTVGACSCCPTCIDGGHSWTPLAQRLFVCGEKKVRNDVAFVHRRCAVASRRYEAIPIDQGADVGF
jgi:hypothetical protein